MSVNLCTLTGMMHHPSFQKVEVALHRLLSVKRWHDTFWLNVHTLAILLYRFSGAFLILQQGLRNQCCQICLMLETLQ